METREAGGVPAARSCLRLWPVCPWPVEGVRGAAICTTYPPWATGTEVAHGWGWSCVPQDRGRWPANMQAKIHTHTRQLLSQVQTLLPSFNAKVTLATSSRWIYANHCVSAGNHLRVLCRHKARHLAQTAVIPSYIGFLLPWLMGVNVNSWTNLFCVISLFWYVSDMLTGLTSHFGTRPFVTMRLFPASAFLVFFLGTEGCCRRCRNSVYIEQKERKKDPGNETGKQHSGRDMRFLSKMWWQPLVVSISHQKHFQWYQQ